MKVYKYTIPVPKIGTGMPTSYFWASGILFLFFLPILSQKNLSQSHTPFTHTLIGTWKIYTLETNKMLIFSHYEEYKAGHEFSQWNSTFSAKGRWSTNGEHLCVKFDATAKTDCGSIEFKDDNTFYYLEEGSPISELLVCKRIIPTTKPLFLNSSTPANSSPVSKNTTSSSYGNKEEVVEVPCKFCDASGKKSCIWCYGTGRKTRTITKYEGGSTKYVTEEYSCEACSGIGYNICAECNGRGTYKQVKQHSRKN